MLKEIAPHLAGVGVLVSPSTAYQYFVQAATAAVALPMEVVPSRVENAADIERAIESFARRPNGGLLLPPDSLTVVHRDLVIMLAARHRLPAVYGFRVFVTDGGLMSYGDRSGRHVSAVGVLCRPIPARRQSHRPAGGGANQIPNGAQPQNGEGAGSRRSAIADGARRRDDRVNRELN